MIHGAIFLSPIRPVQILPDNAILVADGGDFVGSAAYILRPRGPLKWLGKCMG